MEICFLGDDRDFLFCEFIQSGFENRVIVSIDRFREKTDRFQIEFQIFEYDFFFDLSEKKKTIDLMPFA